MLFPHYKSNHMIHDDLLIIQATPDQRFDFQQVPNNNSLKSMLIRFLSEYGPDVAENDPDEVLIVYYTHVQTGNNLHHLEIDYQINGTGYQVEVAFNYFPTPSPDFFTNVAFDGLGIYEVSQNSLS